MLKSRKWSLVVRLCEEAREALRDASLLLENERSHAELKSRLQELAYLSDMARKCSEAAERVHAIGYTGSKSDHCTLDVVGAAVLKRRFDLQQG